MANEKRLIDANAVAKDIRENNRENFNQLDWSSKQVCQLLENAPTVDAVEVVHARWTNAMQYGDSNCVGFCSNCATEQTAQSATALKAFHKYCRWCGAKMDGDGNGC